jgi:hypothetical protein
MAGESGYEYRILQVLEALEDVQPNGDFRDLGWHKARNPDDAIEAAAKEHGLEPTRCVAVAGRWWIEREVGKELQPVYQVTPVSDVKPKPEPEPGPGELDPSARCATEGCGHLPGDHGAEGKGMCRVDGCPCGGYKDPGPQGSLE